MQPIVRCLFVAALAAAPLPATGEALGRITAYLDGVPQNWHTVTMQQGGRKVATASFTQGARLSELRIQGHPEPRFSTRGVFSLEVRYLGIYVPATLPLSVDVMYVPEGLGGPFWTSRGATRPATVDVVELETWGNYGRLVAAFDAELCLRAMISAFTDPTTCREVTGVIETELSVE